MWIPPKNLAAFKRFNSTFILWACLHIERSSIEFRRASVPKFMWPWTSQTSHRAVEYWTTQGKCNINILSWVGNFNETLTKAWENLERCKSSKDGWLWLSQWQCNLKCQRSDDVLPQTNLISANKSQIKSNRDVQSWNFNETLERCKSSKDCGLHIDNVISNVKDLTKSSHKPI